MKKKSVDYKLFFASFILVIFGMIMISSVSVYSSFKLTNLFVAKGLIDETYNYFYVIRNIIHVFIALSILAISSKIPYKFFEKYVKFFGIGTIILLIFVLVKGMTIKGATGWINIPGLPFTIQPTEFLKFSLIIVLAYFFKNYHSYLGSFKKGFLPFMGIVGVVVLLVGLQPDFGTLMVVLPVSVIMYFATGARVKYLLIFIFLGIFLILFVYFYGEYDKKTGKNINKFGYITKRIDNFLEDNKTSISNKTINYQTKQGLIAIGSGGFMGLGFGNSIQKFGYLPEVQGDFIFSVIVEELGFVGAFILLNIYLFIAYRGLYIASNINDLFAKYSAIGISSWIFIQAFINIGVNLNIVPLTGLTLPFISYGGSSLLSLGLAIGFLLNISRYIDDKPKYSRVNKKFLGL